MMKRFGILLIASVVAVAGWCANAFAHQQKAAITTISHNEQSGTFEIIHRFSLHDAEHAVKRILYREADIYSSEHTQQKFAEYVHKHFSVSLEKGALVPLVNVGHELDGRHFWIYQEVAAPEEALWTITHSALQEIWPSQVNTVNVEAKGKVKTLVFTNEEPKHQIVIPLK